MRRRQHRALWNPDVVKSVFKVFRMRRPAISMLSNEPSRAGPTARRCHRSTELVSLRMELPVAPVLCFTGNRLGHPMWA